LGENFAALTVIAGALADIVIGLTILWRPASRYGLWAALIISLVYVVIGTALVPRLWADPLGPMLKIWPVLILNLVAMAIREDR
ncbi:nucleoside-diphosphate sugar epimerase, partial [Bradyrhizobium sp. CSA112]|uniref:DoxX-like family protein n=1 Tax=Bradyrhizobium sp. CSA112 TaxID=2699170 RepID=UPI0023B1442C